MKKIFLTICLMVLMLTHVAFATVYIDTRGMENAPRQSVTKEEKIKQIKQRRNQIVNEIIVKSQQIRVIKKSRVIRGSQRRDIINGLKYDINELNKEYNNLKN